MVQSNKEWMLIFIVFLILFIKKIDEQNNKILIKIFYQDFYGLNLIFGHWDFRSKKKLVFIFYEFVNEREFV